MKIGDLVLVRYHNNQEHLGIVVELGKEWSPVASDVKVAWDDGDVSWILKRSVEVLDESR
jgi:hypothetical protein